MDGKNRGTNSIRKVMIVSTWLGGFLTLFGFTLPIAVSLAGLDAVLTPEELNNPDIKRVAAKVLHFQAQARLVWIFSAIGAAIFGLNVYGLAKCKKSKDSCNF